MNLPKNIPDDLSELLQVMATDFPAILSGNLVGIYLWGSLTYETFDETYSDVDCIGVTRRDLDDREFPELDEWFNTSAGHEYSASWLGTAIKCEDDLDQVVCSQQTFCKGDLRIPVRRHDNGFQSFRCIRDFLVLAISSASFFSSGKASLYSLDRTLLRRFPNA